MKRNKLNKEDRYKILEIIGHYIYDREVKPYMDKVNETFEEELIKCLVIYEKTFNITEDVKKFCLKYNMFNNSYTVYKDGCNKYNYNTLNYFYFNKYSKDCPVTLAKNLSFEQNFSFPFYDKLCFVPVTIDEFNFNGSFSIFLEQRYRETCKDLLEEVSEKSKYAYELYSKFESIINSCIYEDEVRKFVEIQHVIDYLDCRFRDKLSTELSTINQETVDFIKMYLTSKK